MLPAFDAVIEQRISEAVRRGDFDDLPGAGQPLDLDDDRLVPEELRMAYRILKNAGYVPPEVQTLKDIGELQRLIHTLGDDAERSIALKRLHLLSLQMSEMRGGSLEIEPSYYDQLLQRLTD